MVELFRIRPWRFYISSMADVWVDAWNFYNGDDGVQLQELVLSLVHDDCPLILITFRPWWLSLVFITSRPWWLPTGTFNISSMMIIHWYLWHLVRDDYPLVLITSRPWWLSSDTYDISSVMISPRWLPSCCWNADVMQFTKDADGSNMLIVSIMLVVHK